MLSKIPKKSNVQEAKKYVLRCPQCLSSDVDLWLGGRLGHQTYRCHSCGFIGASFIEVEEGSFEELYDRLTKAYCGNKEKLEKDIRSLRKKGLSREQSVLKLALEKGANR